MSSRSTKKKENPSSLRGLDYCFDHPELLEQALTHRSLGNPHNERLEFLGDSVLNVVISELLFHLRPTAPEGDLSRLRSRLVRDRTLAQIAREINLGEHVRLGPGELKSGGFLRESILADALEAIIGAAFLDRGFDAARQLVVSLTRSRVESLPAAEDLKDPKTRLQELLQGRGLGLPVYEVIEEQGQDHERRFTVTCRVSLLDQASEATAGSRRGAEQAAASLALQEIQGELCK
ncbi:MAG: ribonuclease III [Wenzhouxiangellaceae bacterium]|nr:ribonuclease III [Wenzhouxiangellaceae bacterium]